MKNTVVSERYAQALFSISQDQNLTEKIQDDLKLVTQTLSDYPEFRTLLAHPVISTKDKKEMFEKIFLDNISQYTKNIIMLLIDKKRDNLIPEVAELYREMYNNLHSRVVADVYTSIEVGENVLSLLRKKLEEYLDKEVEIDTHVDKSILGGVLVKIGDRVIDGTLKTKFENMAKSLR